MQVDSVKIYLQVKFDTFKTDQAEKDLESETVKQLKAQIVKKD